MPPKATQLKADSPAFQPGAFAKSKASMDPPAPPTQARGFQPQGRAAQAAPLMQPQRSAAPPGASMAPPLPGYIGSYGLPHPGQVMMMPAVGMGTVYEPSAMGGEGYPEGWGYHMPAMPPSSDQFPVHLGPNTVDGDGFWDQVCHLASFPEQSACLSEGVSLRMLPELSDITIWAAVCLCPRLRPGPNPVDGFWDQVHCPAPA